MQTVAVNVTLFSDQTGLTLEAQPYAGGATSGAVVTGTTLEIGGGSYIWTASVPDNATKAAFFDHATHAALNVVEDFPVATLAGAVLLQATQTGVTIPTVTTLTNAPSDSSGTTTLLARLTSARAGYLDTLNGIVAAIWAAVTDSSGVATLLTRLTGTRAGYLDNLSAAPPTASAIHDAIISNANKIAPDSSGYVSTNNFPVEFLSSAEQTELTVAVNDLVALLARTDVAPSVASITGSINTILSRLPSALTFTGANVNANAQVISDKTGFSGVATNLPSDYQQRGVAVTLPSSAPTGYGGGSATLYGESGSKNITFTCYDEDGVTPLAGVAVHASSDTADIHQSIVKVSDDLGDVSYKFDPGEVYFWLSRFDKTFNNPYHRTVT